CPITEVSAHAGIDLARWFAAEVTRVYAMLRESDEERQLRKLVEWIAAHGGRATARDLQRANSRRWPTSDLAEDALQSLVEAELGRWVEGAAPEGGGHRPRWFELSKAALDISDTRSEDNSPLDEGPPETRTDNRPRTPGGDPDWFHSTPSSNGSCGE